MTATEHPTQGTDDPTRLAADARSILACPATVSMVIEGEARLVDDEADLTVSDHHGTPTFVCRTDSPVARAAAGNASALLTVTSGLGPRGGPDRLDSLTLAGRLERTGYERCDCCDEVRDVVSLDLSFVLLTRPVPGTPHGTPDRQHRVPLEQFRSHAHLLNRGHLQRSVEHANECHQEELRQAVSFGTSTRPAELIGVRLAHLTPSNVELQWVDVDGAHRQVLTFPRAARTLTELGEMLRRGLHAGIC
ncbi:hypothetical protein [Nocardioides mangrovi]|uniref:DUF2470 domain-containing protein n=1 Tax=Nocardioides mangrovi TaxID=2874580 RepID=A0ABS7U7S8_9ACTN|nr:hypothetical protein [Nocardioides mangrovi]MBZ5736722.1 hypothetical protein [Nocardioides mangrovi]